MIPTIDEKTEFSLLLPRGPNHKVVDGRVCSAPSLTPRRDGRSPAVRTPSRTFRPHSPCMAFLGFVTLQRSTKPIKAFRTFAKFESAERQKAPWLMRASSAPRLSPDVRPLQHLKGPGKDSLPCSLLSCTLSSLPPPPLEHHRSPSAAAELPSLEEK